MYMNLVDQNLIIYFIFLRIRNQSASCWLLVAGTLCYQTVKGCTVVCLSVWQVVALVFVCMWDNKIFYSANKSSTFWMYDCIAETTIDKNVIRW